MLEIGVLKNFNSGTYKAAVQLVGSLTTYFDNISVAVNLVAAAMVVGNFVILAIPQGNPKDACVIASWPSGSAGGGAFLDMSDTPSSYSGKAALSPVVNTAETALEFVMRARISTANKTVYIDKAATGAGDGTSWTDAFTSWANCKTWLTGWIIAHDWTIRVRKGSTPYREIFELTGFRVWGTLTIEGEDYCYGDCEANVGGAGEITDTGAFGDVAVGDRVFLLDLNGANGRAQDYEVCTVDSIANAPNRIGTNGSKTPSTGWKYTIVRTEISGSDDGTDGGTARDNCITAVSLDNINIYGFLFTYSDVYFAAFENCRNNELLYSIVENCDRGLVAAGNSKVSFKYSYVDVDLYALVADYISSIAFYYGAINSASHAVYALHVSLIRTIWFFMATANYGHYARYFSHTEASRGTIASGVSTGLKADGNSFIHQVYLTNNATTPVSPTGTSEGAYIT